MTAYYNEKEPFAAQWLRNLIAAGLLPQGDVDERSIEDVRPGDLVGYAQCHFFAGIGVWPFALRQSGWPDDRPVWTGSCPCQPFSAAGKGSGFADERHLWPAFHHLIQEHCPPIVFGEQVASKDGLAWLDLIQADMEGADYAFGAADLCAAGVGAPHIRQRLFWVADACGEGLSQRVGDGGLQRPALGDPERQAAFCSGNPGGLAQPDGAGRVQGFAPAKATGYGNSVGSAGSDAGPRCPGPVNGPWRNADWLRCRDGKWRPVESGTLPLVDRAPSRVGRLRAYGNAIVTQVATEFIKAYLDWETAWSMV